MPASVDHALLDIPQLEKKCSDAGDELDRLTALLGQKLRDYLRADRDLEDKFFAEEEERLRLAFGQ